MDRGQRIGLIVAAVVVAVVAFLIIKPGDDNEGSDSSKPAGTQTTQTTAPAEPATSDKTDTSPGGTGTEKANPAEPDIPPIEIENGKPAAGVEEFQFKKGDTIVFAVRSDEAHEIHFHGYDVSKDVAAGKTVVFKVPAKIEGIFEVEIEDTKTQIAEVKVTP
jgi:hypothetical protein